MIVYSVFEVSEGTTRHFATLAEAKCFARTLWSEEPTPVEKNEVGRLNRRKLAALLNGEGWCESSEVAYEAPPTVRRCRGFRDRGVTIPCSERVRIPATQCEHCSEGAS